MKLATWNVNSLKVRLPQVLEWAGKHRPDVLCLQETKLQDEQFPAIEIRAAGYEPLANGHAPADRRADVVRLVEGGEHERQRSHRGLDQLADEVVVTDLGGEGGIFEGDVEIARVGQHLLKQGLAARLDVVCRGIRIRDGKNGERSAHAERDSDRHGGRQSGPPKHPSSPPASVPVARRPSATAAQLRK